MALPIQTAALWADERRRHPWSGSILQFGRQSIFFDRHAFNALCRHYSLPMPTATVEKAVDDQEFFRAVGFQSVESLDVVDSEQPTHIADLNQPLPVTLTERYDCVFDGGTLEHVFDIAAGLRSMASAVRIGGRAVHMVVTSNYIDHGFYQLCPTLLWDFYAANGFTIERAVLIELLVSGAAEFLHPWRVYRYTVGCCDHFNSGAWGFSPQPVACWLVARKTERREKLVAPMQSLYSRWAGGNDTTALPTTSSTYKTWLKRHARWAYLHLVDVRRWLHTPRPPMIGTINAEGEIQRRSGWDG